MGSPTISNSKPETAIMEKKSIKDKLIKPLQALFSNKKKDKFKKEPDLTEEFDKLQIKNKEKTTEAKPNEKVTEVVQKTETKDSAQKEYDEDEEFSKNFTVKVIDENSNTDRNNRDERIGSHGSEDSGFAEIEAQSETQDADGKAEEVIEGLQNLKIDGKEKKLQTVHITRGPTKTSVNFIPSTHPYSLGSQAKADFSQINQVNKQTFSGGHVTVARKPELTEVDIAFKNVVSTSPHYSLNTPQAQDYLNLVQELIDEEYSEPKDDETDILAGFIRDACDNVNLHNFVQNEISKITEPNPIEEFTNINHINYEEYPNLESITNFEDEFLNENCNSIFPTPPRDYISSPVSDSQQSNYPTSSEYQLSPPLSSPLTNDYESYQDISQFDDSVLPVCVTDDALKRERNGSSSSMTMKQYKDKQKELSMDFSKHECCQLNKKSCKEIFEGYMKKLKPVERRGLCLKVANLDLKTAYGVLQHILLSLSHETDQEDVQYSLFALICDRVLATQAELFVQDFGLNLIKSAALRCPHRWVLTRRLVQCAHAALKENPDLFKGKDAVFREVDAQGDNLLMACARAGDTHADVLAELVTAHEPPLFSVHHHNAEGDSALHVCCRLHSASRPRLRLAHVLLTHAGADLWRGDVKGGDTALHLAVNSPTCDLNLVLTLFKHVDRKLWKKLAHVNNRSSVTPLEYARCATKSTTRQDYPPEVLEFLKKCR